MSNSIENFIDSKSMNLRPTYSFLDPAIDSENGVVVRIL